MTQRGLSRILKTQIPLSKAMGIKVVRCSVAKGVEFRLPLKPNRNHKSTAFGGTLIAAQALAAWAWIMALLEEENAHAEVVVQRQYSEFLKPVNKNFHVIVKTPGKEATHRFITTLKRHNKARITIEAEVYCGEKVAVTYAGDYVAIGVKK